MHRSQRILAVVASFVGATIVACQSHETTSPHDVRGLVAASAANVGQEAKCETILITAPTVAIAVGGTVQFTANAYGKNGKLVPRATAAWSSLNPEVAAVSSTGLVTGIGSGSTIIRATCSETPGLGELQINVQ
jgi:hypothetical protein